MFSVRRRFRRCCFVCVIGAFGYFNGLAARAATQPDPITIDKVYFLFHPVCWQMGGEEPPQGVDAENWTTCYNRELLVNKKQKQFMSQMKQNEALVLFPISRSPAMIDLEQHATRTLGRRCVIVRRGGQDPPRAWAALHRPFERFLNDPHLKGRSEFLTGVPDDIQAELAAEIRAARKLQSGSWNIAVLEVAYYSRLCAMDIKNEFKKNNIVYDTTTVRSEAFGEGFEQCAMTWKQMLVPYLGFAHPADNNFDLSVSGAPFLVNATLKERVALTKDQRLFLWRGEKGRLIAMFTRAWCRLRDPQLYAHVPLAGLQLEVRECHNKKCWPQADGKELQLAVDEGLLRVPVFNGIRRDFDWRNTVRTDEEACYLLAKDISLQDFRDRLVNSMIGE